MNGYSETPNDEKYKRVALAIAALGTLVGVLNGSTLIIALPTIMVQLHTTLFGVMWALIVYMLITTILAPAWGRLADIYGRKRLYVWGLVTFTIGSVLCGFSADIGQLIGFRVIQAIGGSLLVANGTIIVTDAYPRGELGRAMGFLSMIMAAAFVAGPILGGVLTLIDWRLNFFFNIPFGVVAIILAQWKLREVVDLDRHQQFDLLGLVYFTIAVIALMVYVGAGFIVGLLSPAMLAALVVGLISTWAFIRQEQQSRSPLIDLSLFRIKIFTYGQVSALLNSIGRGAVMILLILFFQGVKGEDPFTASIMIAPLAIALTISGPIGGRLADKYGSRLIATTGLIISLVGLLGLALMHYDTPYWYLATCLFINGFGSGLFQPPNTSAIMSSVPPDRRGVTSSIRAFFGNMGMMISMSFATPILLGTISMDDMMRMFVVGGSSIPVVVQQTFTGGITLAFLLSSLITVPAIIVSALRGKDDLHHQHDIPAERIKG